MIEHRNDTKENYYRAGVLRIRLYKVAMKSNALYFSEPSGTGGGRGLYGTIHIYMYIYTMFCM